MLESPLPEFWSAWRRLSGSVRRTAWGEVVSDARYPLVWEANHAAVLRNHVTIIAADIRVELLPALEASGAAYEHVEFWDPAAWTPALEELRPGSEHGGVDAVMIYRGDPEGPTPPDRPGPEVTELTDTDERFWDVYRTSRGEFDGAFGDDIVDQLVLRDRQLLVPAGLRAFGAKIDGELAAFVTLISLAGVGYVDNVVTLPSYRRRGVASAGVTAAVGASMASGDAATHLLTEAGSDAQRLYERLGFEQTARVSSVTRRLPGD